MNPWFPRLKGLAQMPRPCWMLLVGIAILCIAQPAHADFAVRINGFLVHDGDFADLDGAVDGSITVQSGLNGAPIIPGIMTQVTVALSNSPGDENGALLDVAYQVKSSKKSGGSVTIEA